MINLEINTKLQTTDARVWAECFMEILGGHNQAVDMDLMTAWFASAIMCGYDAKTIQDKPMVDALQRLARLGNGDRLGNSDGNLIAQNALRQMGYISGFCS